MANLLLDGASWRNFNTGEALTAGGVDYSEPIPPIVAACIYRDGPGAAGDTVEGLVAIANPVNEMPMYVVGTDADWTILWAVEVPAGAEQVELSESAEGLVHIAWDYSPGLGEPTFLEATGTYRIWVESPEPPAEPCCPLSNSRLFKGIASKYRAAQHQPIRARRSQKRCLQVDFNGALDEGDTITQVTWECVSPWITFMEKAGIGENGRYVCVDVTFNYPGIGYVKATVDTASGSRENYEFEVTVSDAPMYPTAQYIPSNGPYQLVATA